MEHKKKKYANELWNRSGCSSPRLEIYSTICELPGPANSKLLTTNQVLFVYIIFPFLVSKIEVLAKNTNRSINSQIFPILINRFRKQDIERARLICANDPQQRKIQKREKENHNKIVENLHKILKTYLFIIFIVILLLLDHAYRYIVDLFFDE